MNCTNYKRRPHTKPALQSSDGQQLPRTYFDKIHGLILNLKFKKKKKKKREKTALNPVILGTVGRQVKGKTIPCSLYKLNSSPSIALFRFSAKCKRRNCHPKVLHWSRGTKTHYVHLPDLLKVPLPEGRQQNCHHSSAYASKKMGH